MFVGLLDLFGTPAYSFDRDASTVNLAASIALAKENGTAGVGFAEVMTGFIHAGGDITDFDVATKYARSRAESARFFLSVKSWNTSECKNKSTNPPQLDARY
jgi:hypothetical protein